jgi:hypothetical protein
LEIFWILQLLTQMLPAALVVLVVPVAATATIAVNVARAMRATIAVAAAATEQVSMIIRPCIKISHGRYNK